MMVLMATTMTMVLMVQMIHFSPVSSFTAHSLQGQVPLIQTTKNGFPIHNVPQEMRKGTNTNFKHIITCSSSTSTSTSTTSMKMNRRNDDNYDDEDEDFEFARVGRRRRRDRYSSNDEGYGYDSENSSSSSSSRSRQRQGYDYDNDEDIYDEVDFDDDEEDDDDYYDEYDEDYDDVIPNALLDQIDPDGAIERMPELFSDPQFYRDAAIVVVLFIIYAFGRLNNPLYDIKDVNQIDFSQFY